MTTSQTFESYVPVYDMVPEKWENARAFLSEQLRRIAYGVNSREIGFFLNEELLCGQQFIPGITGVNGEFRSIFRMVVVFDALPNTTTKTVAHNIKVDANFSLMNMYISATDPIGLTGFSLQYWSKAASDIVLSYDATNVIVTTGSDYSNFTKSYVVMEYILQL